MFFKKCKIEKTSKRLFSCLKKEWFDIKGNSQRKGQLIQIKAQGFITPNWINDNIILKNPDSLIFITIPTNRIKNGYSYGVDCGHNAVVLTDAKSQIESCMSKRPNINKVLYERKRAPDKRLDPGYSPFIKIYEALFTSYLQELNVWYQRAKRCQDYPLFIHIIPCKNALGIDASLFKANVEEIKGKQDPYALLTYIDPITKRHMPGLNCNTGSYDSIYLSQKEKNRIWQRANISAMCCQESIITSITPFVNGIDNYHEITQALGLTVGIESPQLQEDNFYAIFTC